MNETVKPTLMKGDVGRGLGKRSWVSWNILI